MIIINIFDVLFLFLFFVFCFWFYLLERSKIWIELLELRDSIKYFIPSEPIWFPIPNIYSKKGGEKIKGLIIIEHFWFIGFYFLFYLPPRSKVWIELLDLSDSLKYFIPSEPILFPIPNILAIPNIYSKKKKKGLEKIELIR